MIGIDQPRHFRFDGNRLVLSAEIGEDRIEIVWEKRDATKRR